IEVPDPFSGRHSVVTPSTSKVQLTPPRAKIQINANEKGYLNYERYWSRDPRFVPQTRGDTPTRAILGRIGHAYEVYPFICIATAWLSSVIFVGWWSLSKVEVRINKNILPMSWEHLRDDYFKRNTVLFDWDGRTHRRLLIMEKLQDEMLEASQKRSKSDEQN
uniref:Uncharacterized protein n=1 Tax=Parascaris univalens TaxID=6257 RepID=A0A914ZJY8_PARUN